MPNKKEVVKKGESFVLISNLILSIIAFSFLIGLVNVQIVGGETVPTDPALEKELANYFSPPQPPSTTNTPPAVAPPPTPPPIEPPADAAAGAAEKIGGVLEEGKVPAKSEGTLSKLFGLEAGTTADALVSGLQWAGIAYVVGTMLIGPLFGLNEDQSKALGLGLASGFGVYKIFATAKPGTWLADSLKLGGWGPSAHPALWGIGIGLVIFIMMYKEENKKVVTFTCNPWEAPVGGADCEKCNNDLFKPCSEYRCRSLGQACELLNPGSKEEACAWVHKDDVKSPGISPWDDVLTFGHEYRDVVVRPPGDASVPGRMSIEQKREKCVEAFTPLEFGIVTSEPAECKIDYNHTSKFDDMQYYFGESNLYKYNHSQIMRLPGPENIKQEAPKIKTDGTYALYARCRDKNGNENVDEFTIKFCVKPGPDLTAPVIEQTSIINGMPVKFGLNETDLDIFLNEPAECKWDRRDRSYESMEKSFESCATSLTQGTIVNNQLYYKCSTTLTGIKNRDENVYYFSCKDQPSAKEEDRNANENGYKFTLIGTQPLNIIKVKPNNETIKGYSTEVEVNLEVETANGYSQGDANCEYSTGGNNYIKFFETGTNKHKQSQNLAEGSYNYNIKCYDLGSNTDYGTASFYVDVDQDAPVVVRTYNLAGNSDICGNNGCLKIITNEESTCSYSLNDCNFDIIDGTNMPYDNSEEHYAEWRTDIKYFIRCKDEAGNEPNPNACSIIVRAYELA